MADEQPIIVTEQLCRTFGSTQALSNLDLTVKCGELFCLVGPDGAGKTTTMRILAGILDPTSGDAWVDGVSVTENPEEIKEHIAYMPQRFGLYDDLTVLENLIFYADLFRVPRKERSERLERLFEFSRLGGFQDRPARALSGGMRQKLALTCALIHSPRLLLLDEPTNGVDPVSRRDFWKILYDLLADGMSILVSTAYLDEAERAHRIGLMNNGSLVKHGEPKALKEEITGAFYELTVDDVTRGAKILVELDEALDLNVFGEGLHVRLDEDQDPEILRERLTEKGIEVESLRRISPAVEDVFLAVIPEPTLDVAPTEE